MISSIYFNSIFFEFWALHKITSYLFVPAKLNLRIRGKILNWSTQEIKVIAYLTALCIGLEHLF